ncbi:helix-loop-helix DNA-binding domain-containing protein [Ditylenchus destructor]|nr:helix-loop-helix DNA-binding domain-containing protein [Ditylenchus destructor]
MLSSVPPHTAHPAPSMHNIESASSNNGSQTTVVSAAPSSNVNAPQQFGTPSTMSHSEAYPANPFFNQMAPPGVGSNGFIPYFPNQYDYPTGYQPHLMYGPSSAFDPANYHQYSRNPVLTSVPQPAITSSSSNMSLSLAASNANKTLPTTNPSHSASQPPKSQDSATLQPQDVKRESRPNQTPNIRQPNTNSPLVPLPNNAITTGGVLKSASREQQAPISPANPAPNKSRNNNSSSNLEFPSQSVVTKISTSPGAQHKTDSGTNGSDRCKTSTPNSNGGSRNAPLSYIQNPAISGSGFEGNLSAESFYSYTGTMMGFGSSSGDITGVNGGPLMDPSIPLTSQYSHYSAMNGYGLGSAHDDFGISPTYVNAVGLSSFPGTHLHYESETVGPYAGWPHYCIASDDKVNGGSGSVMPPISPYVNNVDRAFYPQHPLQGMNAGMESFSASGSLVTDIDLYGSVNNFNDPSAAANMLQTGNNVPPSSTHHLMPPSGSLMSLDLATATGGASTQSPLTNTGQFTYPSGASSIGLHQGADPALMSGYGCAAQTGLGLGIEPNAGCGSYPTLPSHFALLQPPNAGTVPIHPGTSPNSVPGKSLPTKSANSSNNNAGPTTSRRTRSTTKRPTPSSINPNALESVLTPNPAVNNSNLSSSSTSTQSGFGANKNSSSLSTSSLSPTGHGSGGIPAKIPRKPRSRSSMTTKDDSGDDSMSIGEDKEVDRRMANNTRERIRVRDINQAFRELARLCSQHMPNTEERTLTKLGTLHKAVELIPMLEERVRNRNLDPRVACFKRNNQNPGSSSGLASLTTPQNFPLLGGESNSNPLIPLGNPSGTLQLT